MLERTPANSANLQWLRLAERRQLTVMFCDLVGSTSLSRTLDPEALREVMHGYQVSVQRIVTAHGGFVAHYMGDGVLAYFGFPHADEDDPVRALEAALEIADAVASYAPQVLNEVNHRMQTRVGIATGLVVVGDLLAHGGAEQFSAVGETLNLAAQLQTHANPDTVIVSALTRELADGRFDFAEASELSLKGYDHPVRASRVLGRSTTESRFHATRGRKFGPFIARNAELEVLHKKWRHTCAGSGRAVLVTGDAGLGKSRLVEAFTARLVDEPHIRRRYQCSANRSNTALYPFIENIERAAGFRHRDSIVQKREKLHALLESFPISLTHLAPLFALLLSLPPDEKYPLIAMSPARMREKTFAALREQLRYLSQRAPVVVVLEDAHWIDPTSLELMNEIIHDVADLRVMVVVTTRDPSGLPWLDTDHVLEIGLEKMTQDDSENLIRQLPGTEGIRGDLLVQIVEKSDGVPLFIEEITRAVVASQAASNESMESGPATISVPSSLQDSLMARLDKLGVAKHVAQLGAVIGREFSRDLLLSIAGSESSEIDNALNELVASGVVSADAQPLWNNFHFKHALVQDAAYGSLLRKTRQEVHSRVATSLEAEQDERVRTEPEIVAHHFSLAGNALRGAYYWAAAASRALDRSANLEALGYTTRGIDTLDAASESSERDGLEFNLRILQGTAYRAVKGFASSEVERSFQRALELTEKGDDIARMVDVRRGLFSHYYGRGEHLRAHAQGEKVIDLGQREGDQHSLMQGYWMRGCSASWLGNLRAACDDLERALTLHDPARARSQALSLQIDPGVNALGHLGWVQWLMGHPQQALETCTRAVANSRELKQPYALSMSLYFACATLACCGQHSAASPLLDEMVAVAHEHGFAFFGSCARLLKAQESIRHGRFQEGIDQVEQALAEYKVQGAGPGVPWALSIAALGYAGMGRVDDGLATIARAFDVIAHSQERQWEAELWRLKGNMIVTQGAAHFEEGQDCLLKAINVAQTAGSRALELRARVSLVGVLDPAGGLSRGIDELATALRAFPEECDTADLSHARQLVGAVTRNLRRNH